MLYAPVSYRPPTTPPKIDPDALPEAPHALLLGFLLDRLPVLNAIRSVHLSKPGYSPLRLRWSVNRAREQALTVMDQDHIANMVQVVRASLHPTVTHRCEHCPIPDSRRSGDTDALPATTTVLHFLSSLLSARTAYFRLILLGLRVSVAVHRRDHAIGSTLRQQVCRAAFAWFRNTPGYDKFLIHAES